jgi:N-acetylmuramoyl-L-alanine amidase
MRSIERFFRGVAGLVLTGAVAVSAQTAPQNIPPAAVPALSRQYVSAPIPYLVLLDPAHGGTDAGATLKSGEPEKDATLSLALRLRALLQARGIHTELTRTADISVDNTARATRANRLHPAACLVLHATSSGYGVHLFTSSLPPARTPPHSFLPWDTAQASYSTQSLHLESAINDALTSRHLAVLLQRTSLKPLDNLACPSVAVEVAPLSASTPVDNPQYRDTVIEALAAALVSWRNDRRGP